MPKLTITAGPTRIEIENGDVDNVSDLLNVVRAAGMLNIPDGATPVVNGAAATADTVLEDGDEVAFNKAAGEKGTVVFVLRK